MDDPVSPKATATVLEFGFEIEFGSPPLYTNPFLIAPSPDPSERTSKYLDRLNTLGFTESEQAIIFKLHLDWTFCHTKWPAFHWDMDALKSNARDWVGGQNESVFDLDADDSLWEACDLLEKEIEAVVGPQDSTSLSRSRSNSIVAVSAPIVDNSDDVSKSVAINANPAEIIDDVKGEDIPRYGTPDFKILRSSSSNPTRPYISPIPTHIPLPLSHLGSEDTSASSKYSESVSYGPDLDLDLEWHWLRSFSAFNRSCSSFDPDSESAPIEIEEIELPRIIGSSLVTLLDLDESGECFGQDEIVPIQMGDLGENEQPVVVYSSNVSASDITLSSETGFGSSNPDITLVNETPMDPVKLSKLTRLSTIPVAGDPSLLRFLSSLPIPPFPESQSQTQPRPSSPIQLEIFKKDSKSCNKLEIMNTQGAVTNEVGAQLRCGCDGCKPVAMKALFGDWSWPFLDGVGTFLNKEKGQAPLEGND